MVISGLTVGQRDREEAAAGRSVIVEICAPCAISLFVIWVLDYCARNSVMAFICTDKKRLVNTVFYSI
ncbi:hypothetical protein K7X08_026409 [Anisodus acutangulus]|uniref:Uncharacterized protein n=1 Tax=Anisodus acutangulus TaxID=402998 RepID=A0A9Q1LPE2_9SOLA|nr:hypothetical protein K7X08_026409 [Anisodus acutangulus]